MIRAKPRAMQIQSPVLDHLVLPTARLDVARARMAALGFTVAPDGVHPFGTYNACIYFADGTFLEPLAVRDRDEYAAASAAGNAFITLDKKYRAAAGNEGFSALVLATANADADHRRFENAGVSAGQRLDFSRPYRDADGVEHEVSFRLAFAAPARPTASFFFTCERVNAPSGGRGMLEVHPNAVTGIAGIVSVSDEPAKAADFLTKFLGGPLEAVASGLRIALAGAGMDVVDPATLRVRYGLDAPGGDGLLHLAAIAFTCSDIERLRSTLDLAGIPHRSSDRRIIVPAAPGQGADFIFEDLT